MFQYNFTFDQNFSHQRQIFRELLNFLKFTMNLNFAKQNIYECIYLHYCSYCMWDQMGKILPNLTKPFLTNQTNQT
jgi:hypothetical protein